MAGCSERAEKPCRFVIIHFTNVFTSEYTRRSVNCMHRDNKCYNEGKGVHERGKDVKGMEGGC